MAEWLDHSTLTIAAQVRSQTTVDKTVQGRVSSSFPRHLIPPVVHLPSMYHQCNSGYHLTCKEACRYIQEHLVINVETLGQECVVNAVMIAKASKIVEADADFFADMVVRAAETLKVTTTNTSLVYAVKSLNILKVHGAGIKESVLIPGYALNCFVASQAMPRRITDAKIACLNFSLQKCRMKLSVQVVITDSGKLEEVRQRESDITKEKIQKILNAGTNVILCTGGIDDLSLKYLVKAGVMVVRRCRKQDLRRIAKATGSNLP